MQCLCYKSLGVQLDIETYVWYNTFICVCHCNDTIIFGIFTYCYTLGDCNLIALLRNPFRIQTRNTIWENVVSICTQRLDSFLWCPFELNFSQDPWSKSVAFFFHDAIIQMKHMRCSWLTILSETSWFSKSRDSYLLIEFGKEILNHDQRFVFPLEASYCGCIWLIRDCTPRLQDKKHCISNAFDFSG